MRNLLILLLFFFNNNCYCQKQVGLAVDISTPLSLNLDGGNTFLGKEINLGARFYQKFGSILVYLSYQYSGSSIFEYLLRSQLVGGTIESKFFKEKRCKLFVSISAFSEVATNYKNGTLSLYNLPTNNQELVKHYKKYGEVDFDYLHYYESTPIVTNIFIGCDFQLGKRFDLHLGLGYEYRKIRTRYGKWTIDLTTKDIKKYMITSYSLNMIAIQLGLSYTIPFQRHSKTE